MIPSSFEPFGLQTGFEGVFAFEQINGHVAQDCKIFRRTVFSNPAGIFAESNIQTPVQIVFDAPVVSDGLGDFGGVIFKAGDEIG